MTAAFDLSGQVAVVTGGGRGIGRAISVALAEAGADVVPAARTRSEVEETVAAVRDMGSEAVVCPTDVTDEDGVRGLFEQTVADLGGVDVVVNNAGVNPEAAIGTPEAVELDAYDKTLEVNLRGAFLCARIAAEHLHADGGALVNVASVAGVVGLPGQHPYVASKHGLVGLTKSLAIDWGPTVRVNALAPGFVATDLTEELQNNERLRESILGDVALERFADPAEVAAPAMFLASEAASYVSGACLCIDGGWTAR